MPITADEDLYGKGRRQPDDIRTAPDGTVEHIYYGPGYPEKPGSACYVVPQRENPYLPEDYKAILSQARWDEVTKGLTGQGKPQALDSVITEVRGVQAAVLQLESDLKIVLYHLLVAREEQR